MLRTHFTPIGFSITTGFRAALLCVCLLGLGKINVLAGVSHAAHHSSSHHSSGGHCHSSAHYHSSRGRASYGRSYYGREGSSFVGKGLSFGIGMPFMNADVSQHYYQAQPDILVNGVWLTNSNGAPLDARLHSQVMSTCTFAFNMGYTMPIAKLGNSSKLALEALGGVELYHWNIGTSRYSENTKAFDSGYSENFNLPVSVNYVFGGEADGHSKLTGAIGAGEAFAITHSRYINNDTRVTTRPFVMAEVGLLAGIVIKLRATAYLGSVTLIDRPTGSLYNAMVADGNIDGNLGVKMTGNGGVNFSLVFMPGFHSSRW